MRLLASGASVQGPAHFLDGSPNQDALCVSGLTGGWCIAVADGLGSRPLSHLGSRKAVQLFRQLARQQRGIAPESVAHNLRDAWLAHFG
ncbi:protein phosphatase 2C domain-containing protein, partial [Pseudomonas aeruginosa]|nr:protein phosphatase 2C domain-containing protein [Pseudomonas aeruginosa]